MKQNKVKKAYCKQHGCFDDCVSKAAPEVVARLDRLAARRAGGFGFKTKTPQDAMPTKGTLKSVPSMKSGGGVPQQRVAKKMDDGIHHLTSVERVRTSPETRTGGLKPLLEVGRRKLDGTPKTGTDSSLSHKINENVRMGASGRSKPVGGTKIREQVGKSLSAHDAFLDSEIAKFGHSRRELKEMGREEKRRFKTEGNPTRAQRGIAGSKEYRKGRKADLKGANLRATGAALADVARHPIATHGLNPNASYRLTAVQRKAALAHKAKKAGVSKAHDAFLDDVSKASAFGSRGDKRNTKYAGAALLGSSAGAHAGTAIGAKVGGSNYRDVNAGARHFGQMAGVRHAGSVVDATNKKGAVKAVARGVKSGMRDARAGVPGYGAAMRGSKIGAAAGLATGVGALAMHRRKKQG